MKVSRAGISTIANVRDRFALFREMAFGQTVRISIEVCVVIDKLTIRAQLINGCAIRVRSERVSRWPIRRGNYGSTTRRCDINRIVNAPFRARFREGISQLLRPHSDNRDDQFRGRP